MSVIDGNIKAPRECEHNWQVASMVFETQNLDSNGRVLIRQPDLDYGRVYLVCLECASHTYTSTSWINFRLYGSEDANPEYIQGEDDKHILNPDKKDGYNRNGFKEEAI